MVLTTGARDRLAEHVTVVVVAQVGTEAVDIVGETRAQIRRVVGDGREPVPARGEEGVPSVRREDMLCGRVAIQLRDFFHDLSLGGLEDGVEAAEDREPEEHFGVVGLPEGAAQEFRDTPAEGSEVGRGLPLSMTGKDYWPTQTLGGPPDSRDRAALFSFGQEHPADSDCREQLGWPFTKRTESQRLEAGRGTTRLALHPTGALRARCERNVSPRPGQR